MEEFSPYRNGFGFAIGGSRFTVDRMILDVAGEDFTISGDLRFSGIHPWPVTALSPGAMGWYAFVPTMECYHGVLSFNHAIEGHLDMGGMRRDFTGGRGYMEKDWGVSMPSSWVWIQSNHFHDPEASLFLSIARIPWRGSYFNGHIAGLWYRGAVRRFATYTGAKLKELTITGDSVSIRLEDRRYGLHVTGRRGKGVDLPAPREGSMTARVRESIDSVINVRYYRVKGEVIFSGTGTSAGIEWAGDTAELR